jgi:hypothetical protein
MDPFARKVEISYTGRCKRARNSGPLPPASLRLASGIDDSKVFKASRQVLGVKTYQLPGKKVGGWFWELADQTTFDAEPAAARII